MVITDAGLVPRAVLPRSRPIGGRRRGRPAGTSYARFAEVNHRWLPSAARSCSQGSVSSRREARRSYVLNTLTRIERRCRALAGRLHYPRVQAGVRTMAAAPASAEASLDTHTTATDPAHQPVAPPQRRGGVAARAAQARSAWGYPDLRSRQFLVTFHLQSSELFAPRAPPRVAKTAVNSENNPHCVEA